MPEQVNFENYDVVTFLFFSYFYFKGWIVIKTCHRYKVSFKKIKKIFRTTLFLFSNWLWTTFFRRKKLIFFYFRIKNYCNVSTYMEMNKISRILVDTLTWKLGMINNQTTFRKIMKQERVIITQVLVLCLDFTKFFHVQNARWAASLNQFYLI